MRSFLLIIVCIACIPVAHPQAKLSTIRGLITDSASGAPLEEASVSLLRQANQKPIRQTLSRKNGFEFNRIPSGQYLLTISFAGYHPDTTRITLDSSGNPFNAGTIPLARSSTNLMEVVIRSVIPPVIVKNDTLVYNTNTVKTEPNASVEDLIKKLPGMQVDKDGNITLHGQKVEKIYVDGKEFFLNDPKMATQNLTADMVEAIEAFGNQSDRARFTGIKEINTNKAINLRLKKDRKKGLLGNTTVKAGTMNTYSGAATATYFKGDRWAFARLSHNQADNLSTRGGIKQSSETQALNFKDHIGKRTFLVLNYTGRGNRNQSGQLYRRETFLGDSSLLQSRDAFINNRSANQQFNINLTYNIDSFSSIIYTASVSSQRTRNTNTDSSFLLSGKNGDSYLSNEGKTMNRVSGNGNGFNNAITYRRLFRKKGRTFYGIFTHNRQRQTQEGNLYSLVKSYDSTRTAFENKTVDQRYDQENSNRNYGLNLSWTEPIKPGQVIDIGYNLDRSSGTSGKKAFNFNPFTNSYDLSDTLTTNDFANRSTQQNFSIGYNYLGDKVQYQLGVSVLYSTLENESSDHKYTAIKERFVNWSPRASVFYRLARQKNLQLQYTGNSMNPTTEMLQPIPDLSNPFLVKRGNPDLKQQFQHRVNIHYNRSDSRKFSTLSIGLGSDYTLNKIVQSSFILSRGIQELMYVNVNGIYNINGNINYGFALNKTKNGGGNVSSRIGYNRDINFVNGRQNIRQGFVYGQQFSLNYQSKEKLFAGISAAITYTRSRYSIGTNLNTDFLSQHYAANITWTMPFHIRLFSDITIQLNGKQANLPGNTNTAWNASVYRNLFKDNKTEIRFAVFDLLNRNKGFNQTIGSNYIETRENAVLRRYFVLSLRYNFRMSRM